MKIEKLYTLSQFVDYLKDKDTNVLPTFDLVSKYNDFLKQPLKKKMFINDIEKPKLTDKQDILSEITNNLHVIDINRWQESEKKIIFEGYIDKLNYWCSEKYHRIDLKYVLKEYFNLEVLAQQTNGQLKLKNVEL